MNYCYVMLDELYSYSKCDCGLWTEQAEQRTPRPFGLLIKLGASLGPIRFFKCFSCWLRLAGVVKCEVQDLTVSKFFCPFSSREGKN